jgi:hypothetical protein
LPAGRKAKGAGQNAHAEVKNAPNPLNPGTTFRFDLKSKARAAINIYDMHL